MCGQNFETKRKIIRVLTPKHWATGPPLHHGVYKSRLSYASDQFIQAYKCKPSKTHTTTALYNLPGASCVSLKFLPIINQPATTTMHKHIKHVPIKTNNDATALEITLNPVPEEMEPQTPKVTIEINKD